MTPTHSRRAFIRSAAGGLAALAGSPALLLAGSRRYDIVVRQGTVFDGLGHPGTDADVGIADGRIVAIGRRLSDAGVDEIDARGLAVCPGFIDIHSHGDGTLWDDPLAESVVRQGVTTIVVGQDGSSAAPRSSPEEVGARYAPSFAAYWTAIERLQPALNVASMVGLGTLRGIAVGDANRAASQSELATMAGLVEQALTEGACGASSGLEYAPGAFAPLDELIALCRPLSRRGLPYATHMRNEDDRVLEAVDESIAVARGASCPLQISHLKTEGPRNWAKLDAVFARIADARAAGVDVAFDRYPYVAYQTGLSNLFPVASQDGGVQAFLARLSNPSTARSIERETLEKVDLIGGWDDVMISGVRAPGDKKAEGQRLGALAQAAGVTPYAYAVGLLERNAGDVGMVGFAMSEANLARILAHPLGMVCSDGGAVALQGPARNGHPHPRSLGTFPRVLGRYVRELRTLTLPQAIMKMTSLPASRVRLGNRGVVAVGMPADVTVFDPATVEDRATFADPFHYPVGIGVVIVNGVVTLRDGSRFPMRTGRGLRPSATAPRAG